ncbi:E3 SUMO-protein ligase ZBED1 [Frankliniella fusca]|uniref:E3 SUMO-protein ligase ZBED1 n=2 Tax=Frankliniella fusca TaxID=407009 RepID=A0AAE1H1C7_9NEOP|nr:E3 SUMO-protein ligase ZBED1 [Frankliniella fusca]
MAPSKVWNHFSQPFNTETGLKVTCKVCNLKLSYKNSTSNLRNHAQNTSSDADSNFRRTSSAASVASTSSGGPSARSHYQGPLDKCVNNINAFAVGGHKDAECTNALLFMLAVDNMPLRTPDKQGFKVFVKALQPAFKIPSETVCTRLLEEKYLVLRARVAQWILSAGNISLTCDIWTHKYSMKPYLGLTCHFKRGKQQMSLELATKFLTQRKTTEYLAGVLREICDKWSMRLDRVRGVTTDGGANIKAAVKQVFGVDKHVHCLAHQLNGIGQKVIGNKSTPPSEVEMTPAEVAAAAARAEEDADGDFDFEAEEAEASGNMRRSILLKTKKIVRFFKQSEIATAKLIELQRAEGIAEPNCLKHVQEVRTRFNSCYDMCDRYLKLASFTARVLLELQRSRQSKARAPEALTAEEEDTLTEMRDLLAPLARATKEISGEKVCTLSKAIPVVRNLVKVV